LSQSDLAKKVKLHYTQIGRYENKGAQPSADILSKLADALDVTTDYLMSGSQDEMAEGISDKELMTQFKRIAKLPKEKKAIVKELLDAFLLKNDLREKLAQ
jgi:transcriptional regulator with XRE-family HTH domain